MIGKALVPVGFRGDDEPAGRLFGGESSAGSEKDELSAAGDPGGLGEASAGVGGGYGRKEQADGDASAVCGHDRQLPADGLYRGLLFKGKQAHGVIEDLL